MGKLLLLFGLLLVGSEAGGSSSTPCLGLPFTEGMALTCMNPKDNSTVDCFAPSPVPRGTVAHFRCQKDAKDQGGDGKLVCLCKGKWKGIPKFNEVAESCGATKLSMLLGNMTSALASKGIEGEGVSGESDLDISGSISAEGSESNSAIAVKSTAMGQDEIRNATLQLTPMSALLVPSLASIGVESNSNSSSTPAPHISSTPISEILSSSSTEESTSESSSGSGSSTENTLPSSSPSEEPKVSTEDTKQVPESPTTLTPIEANTIRESKDLKLGSAEDLTTASSKSSSSPNLDSSSSALSASENSTPSSASTTNESSESNSTETSATNESSSSPTPETSSASLSASAEDTANSSSPSGSSDSSTEPSSTSASSSSPGAPTSEEANNSSSTAALEVTSTSQSTVSPTTESLKNFKDFQKKALDLHNALREEHQSQPLTLNDTLNKMAQEWADHEITETSLRVSPGKRRYAENVYRVSGGSHLTPSEAIELAFKSWGSSSKYFDFDHPKPTAFSQMVWNKTTCLGIGVAQSGSKSVVVATYYPRGNILLVDKKKGSADKGYFFKRNVFPCKHNSSTTESTPEMSSTPSSTATTLSSGMSEETSMSPPMAVSSVALGLGISTESPSSTASGPSESSSTSSPSDASSSPGEENSSSPSDSSSSNPSSTSDSSTEASPPEVSSSSSKSTEEPKIATEGPGQVLEQPTTHISEESTPVAIA